jgi:hypothetical protein
VGGAKVMAKTTARKWYDSLTWVARDPVDTATIFGHHFPKLTAISTRYDVIRDGPTIRWRNRDDPEIHEFEIEPDWMYDDPTTQIQALLVAIKLS